MPRIRRALPLATAFACAATVAAPAAAAPVVVLDGPGRVHVRQDRFLAADALPPAAGAAVPLRARAAGPGVATVLRRLASAGAIGPEERAERLASYQAAIDARRRLAGTRQRELSAVIAITEALASRGELTASRLAAVFLNLDRNREWWTEGRLLANGERVTFKGSRLIFQYYAGQGIQLQPLANFGRANGLAEGGYLPNAASLLDELVPLASDRRGRLAWEYFFSFGGGRPPWTSAMSQGTAIQALARVGTKLGDPAYLDVARRALAIFDLDAPAGVRVRTAVGAHYLLYSFAPGYRVLNGFLQSITGLYDLADLAGNARARRLFDAGDREARLEVPGYDTGAWSMYDRVDESNLSYHQLVTGFLGNLCQRTRAAVYCRTARRFAADLVQPPRLAVLTARVPPGAVALVRFSVSKISSVRMTAERAGSTAVITAATVARGRHAYAWRTPAGGGTFTVRLAATDLAGNRGTASRAVRVG